MRQIQQFTDAIQRIIAKKKEGEEQEAQDLIEQLLGDLQEDKHQQFHSLSLEETISSVERDQEFNPELALAVADLLFEKGEMTTDSESKHSYRQALLLYRKAMKHPDVAFPLEGMQKIDQIMDILDSASLEEVDQLTR